MKGTVVNVSRLTWLAIFGSLLACQKDRVLRPEATASTTTGRLEERNIDKQPQPEYDADAPVDESVNIPAPITGAYLVCAKLSSDSTGLQQQVGCRVESDNGVVQNFKARADNISWTHQTQGSAVDIKVLEEENNRDWLVMFNIQADAAAIESKITFDVAFTMDGMTTKVKTELVMIWNEDCAMPPIQFESLGEKSGVGIAVSDQFRVSHGVRFSTLSGAPVLLAQYNQPNANPVGYFGGPNNTGNFLQSNQNGGKFFITDRHRQTETTETLVIDYDRPVKEASLDLVDVDFSETYVIRAMNAQNQIVDEVQVQAAVAGPRDGQLSRFVVRTPDGSNTITRLQIYGFNPPNATGIGFGIDNIAPRCGK
jgi:hypothetical protein